LPIEIDDSHLGSDGIAALLHPQNAAVNQIDDKLVSGRLLANATAEIHSRKE
jgi:hypothetical protein